MPDVVPFLTAIAQSSTTKPFGRAVPTVSVATKSSPWGPQPSAPAPIDLPVVDVESITAEARDVGRAEGKAETAALRTRLAALIADIEGSRTKSILESAELVADAATAVVSAWVEKSDKTTLFQPLVRSWLASTQTPAAVHVHPADVEAMRAAVGDAALIVKPDVGVAMGNARFASGTLELAHSWEDRLGELRDTIAAALVEHES